MKESEFRVTVLGARGSMACGRADCVAFGGDSSCYMVNAGEETVFLDAGSGLTAAPAQYPKPPVILLSHLHLDHVIGLGMFPGLSNVEQRPEIYVPFCKDPAEAAAAIDRVYSPPFWPLRLGDYTSRPQLLPLPERLSLGDLAIEAVPGNHPGGSMVFRLEYQGKSMVFATDYEFEQNSFERLTTLARQTDLLMVDAQYDEATARGKAGFGHSTAATGLRLMRESGAKRLLLIHHDPQSTDAVLLAREKDLAAPAASYAREGQVICL